MPEIDPNRSKMPDATPQLSSGATSVADLLAAARSAADPAQLVDWEQLSESPDDARQRR
jgi:hypothetical protein